MLCIECFGYALLSRQETRFKNSLATQTVNLFRRIDTQISFTILFIQTQGARNRIGASILHSRHVLSILPVAHPRHYDVSAFWSIAECYGSIMVLAVIHPFSHFRL